MKQKNKIQQILSIDLVAHIHVSKEKLHLRRHPQVPGSCPSILCSTQNAASLFFSPFLLLHGCWVWDKNDNISLNYNPLKSTT